jgi:transcriptional regulator with XRE-family HTH domain
MSSWIHFDIAAAFGRLPNADFAKERSPRAKGEVAEYFDRGGKMPRRGSDDSDRPNPMDVHVGSRVRLRRMLMGMSQGRLGKAVGLNYQQVQKYERGTNRISASQLFDFARVLDVPVSFFFDAVPSELAGVQDRPTNAADRPDSATIMRRETLELVRAYYRGQCRSCRSPGHKEVDAVGLRGGPILIWATLASPLSY